MQSCNADVMHSAWGGGVRRCCWDACCFDIIEFPCEPADHGIASAGISPWSHTSGELQLISRPMEDTKHTLTLRHASVDGGNVSEDLLCKHIYGRTSLGPCTLGGPAGAQYNASSSHAVLWKCARSRSEWDLEALQCRTRSTSVRYDSHPQRA